MSALLEHAEKLRTRADIVDVVGRYVDLRPGGLNMKGLCPFHREKSPSFTVSPSKQIFHCFGCHEGGDVIKFLQKVERLEWIDAVKLLSQQYSLPLPELRRDGPAATQRVDQKEKLFALGTFAVKYFQGELLRALNSDSHEITGYLQRRQISRELAEKFQLGLAADAWSALLDSARSAGYNREALVEAGLVIHNQNNQRYYDRFRKRLIFPIHDNMGRAIAFGARTYVSNTAPDEPKYVNSPETPIYHKGQALYALHLAKETLTREGKALVMEGYMDVIRAHQFGFTNAVATCGTALTEEQARTLKRFCSHAVFIYDGDAAGQKAMLRGTEILLDQGFTISIVLLPDGHDPDSYLLAEGAEAFGNQVNTARNFLDHFLNHMAGEYDRRTPEGKVQIAEAILPLLRRVGKSIAQNEYIRRTAEFLALDASLLHKQLADASGTRSDQLRQSINEQVQSPDSRLESTLLRLVVESAAARQRVLERLDLDWLSQALVRRWFLAIRSSSDGVPTWDSLLSLAESDAEASILRMLALSEEPFDASERTLDNVLARLHRNHLRKTAAELAQQLNEAYNRAPDGEPKLENLIQVADGSSRAIKELGKKYFLKQPGR